MSKLQSGGRDAGGRGRKGGQRGTNMFRVRPHFICNITLCAQKPGIKIVYFTISVLLVFM